MCHFLWLASPLTLTEIRAMLPPGLTADAAESAERRALATAAPDLPHAVRLRAGSCACALYLESPGDGRSEESVLRARYYRDGVPRDLVIRALDRHRRGRPMTASGDASPRARREALAGFAAELARTAGAAFYLRTFDASGALPLLDEAAVERRTVSAVRAAPCTWLAEGRGVVVMP